MSQPFAVFDIDGTVARTSLYLATVHAMMRRSMLPKNDAEKIQKALQAWLARSDDLGFERYGQMCVEALSAALPTIKLTAYDSVVEEVLDKFSHKIYRYTTRLIQDLKKQGYLIFAVSGSEMSIVTKFCQAHGFDDWVGNPYGHDGMYFTGVMGSTFKDKSIYIDQLVSKHACTKRGSIAVGDTHGDIEMLAYVDKPIAFNPNKTLFEHAAKNGWKIIVERKNVVYELGREHDRYILATTN